MKFRPTLTAILLVAAVAPAQQPVSAPLPARFSAPLLHVRFTGPQGMRVHFYQGRVAARGFDAPVSVGLRPGYVYRVKATGIAADPKVALYPTLEVRGSLALMPQIHAADYPAPVVLTAQDLDRALAGVMVTKVIYLEHPDHAVPVSTKSDEPLETMVSADRDPVAEARSMGRPMVIVRFGERQVSEDELIDCSTPDTILMPGDKALSRPRVGPMLPWACVPVYDPKLGPKFPDEECLHDGGDSGRPAGIGPDGKLGGLDPSDSVAEYRDSRGEKRVVASNRVCVCVPRFAIVRCEAPIAEQGAVVGPNGAEGRQGRRLLESRVPSLQKKEAEHLAGLRGRSRPSEAQVGMGLDRLVQLQVLKAEEVVLGPAMLLGTAEVNILTERQRAALKRQIQFARSLSARTGLDLLEQSEQTAVVGRLEGLKIVEATVEARDVTVCNCEPPVTLPDKPLVLCKWADKDAAQVGDVVTFTLKYTNSGGKPITDVAVTDSLTARLEYVPGSAQSTRDAVFTIQENEAGAAILRWEISGKLQPGQAGVVRFKAKIR
jgi:uncharacterized repeat protein (TIGR01451 family)